MPNAQLIRTRRWKKVTELEDRIDGATDRGTDTDVGGHGSWRVRVDTVKTTPTHKTKLENCAVVTSAL